MKLTVAEILEARDLEVGTSAWVRIDQERIDHFAEVTEDRQWIHVDVERARESELGGTIAHGFLVLSLLPKLFFEVLEITDLGRMVNFGIDKVRFLRPVPAGSDIRLEVRLLGARKRSGGALMRIRGEIFRRGLDRRVLLTEMLFLAFPADAPGAG